MDVSRPRSVDWEYLYSKKLEKGMSRSVSEDSLDILFRKSYRELEEKMLRRVLYHHLGER